MTKPSKDILTARKKEFEDFMIFITNEKNWMNGRPVWKGYVYMTLINAILSFYEEALYSYRLEVIEEVLGVLPKKQHSLKKNETLTTPAAARPDIYFYARNVTIDQFTSSIKSLVKKG